MSAYTDQEELEKLKAWWKNYGGALLIGIALGIVLLFGGKYWTRYNEERRFAASEIYAMMIDQARTSQASEARNNAELLVNEYRRTPYAGMAALMLARMSFEAKNVEDAQKYLTLAADIATDPTTEHTAHARLARLHIDAGAYDKALAAVQTKPAPGFEAEYAEIRGDVYTAQGKLEEARKAYYEALEYLKSDSPQRTIVVMKLQDVGASPKQ